jgi:type III pantothenate kinase
MILSFNNSYATPTTLGNIEWCLLLSNIAVPNDDRLLSMQELCTYDFIDIENNYLGGAFSPGLRLRYEALHNFTAKLPIVFGYPKFHRKRYNGIHSFWCSEWSCI